MTLRCKQNELAYIIKSTQPGAIGRLVTTVCVVRRGNFLDPRGQRHDVDFDIGWYFEVNEPMMCRFADGSMRSVLCGTISDVHLRPIRGDLDESTEIAERDLVTA